MNKFKYTSFKIVLLILIIFVFSACTSGNNLIIMNEYTKTTMLVGEQMKLNANTNENENVIWTSDNDEVVEVSDEGLVSALKIGEAVVTATTEKNEGQVKITVISNYGEVLKTIEITGLQTVILNETITLYATVSSGNATIIWSSSDEQIATSDATGTITGLKPGLVTIRASLESDNNVYKEISVLVRTGSGIHEIIYNYIYTHTYLLDGQLDLSSLNSTVTGIVNETKQAVIGVTNYFNDKGVKSTSTGTAAVYGKEVVAGGYKYTAITNYHVIEDNIEVKVYLGDIDEYAIATVIKTNSNDDLAIITFTHQTNIEVINFASLSATINNGDFVIAIGNPGGYTYYGSVTFGVVSYNNRVLKDKETIYIQHDAPINPGNSGGPLFNLKGEIIGINTLKLVSTDIEGMGFAVALPTIYAFLNG